MFQNQNQKHNLFHICKNSLYTNIINRNTSIYNISSSFTKIFVSSKDKDKEEGAKTSDEEEESEEDDSVSQRKESIDTKIEITKVEKHVRILEKENSEVHSPTPSSSSNGKNNKKSDAKKSKFCSLL